MICKICDSKTQQVFNSIVLKKYKVNYYKCNNCGYLFTEEPYWLEEAYSRSINLSDTGLLQRNIYFSKILSIFIFFYFRKDAMFLDYAGGYGVFTRLMRDIGFDFYWDDPYTKNLFANGFEKDLKTFPKFELVTAFEVFEHLVNPVDELRKMLQYTNTVIFSTELMPQEIPDHKEWWYYGFNHGQHISFYTKKSLTTLASKFNLKYYSVRGLHIITPKTLNSNLLVILKLLASLGLFQIVKLGLKSKMYTDHLNIENRID